MGEGVGKIGGNKFRFNNRKKGVKGSSTRKGKEIKLRSDSEGDSEWNPRMEAKTSRKKIKTS